MIRVTFKGADEVKKLFEQIPNRIGLGLIKAMRDSAILIQSLAKTNAPVFRGLLRLSIVQSVEQQAGRIVGTVGSALPYASVVESGRTSGWFPNVDELKVWTRRKLGDERLGFVVARAIKKRGFRAQPYLAPAIESAGPRIDLIFAARVLEAVIAAGGNG